MRPVRTISVPLALASLAATFALVAPFALPASAQTPPVTPSATPSTPATPPALPPAPAPLRDPVPGDIVWALAQEFPFLDERAAVALTSYVTPLVNTDPTVAVLPSEPRHRAVMPAGQLALLMEAAGLRAKSATTPSALGVLGPCKFWFGDEPAGFASGASLAKTADTIASAFVLGVRDLLSIPLERCIPAASPGEAHVLVWVQGTRPPANPERPAPTLLTAGQVASPTGTPLPPAPAKTGTAGDTSEASVLDFARGGALAALLLTLAGVFGARALARRTG